jgi:hypothetical protein
MKKIFTLFIALIFASTVHAFSEITKLDPPELIYPKNGDYLARTNWGFPKCKITNQIKYVICNMLDSNMELIYRDSISLYSGFRDTILFRSLRDSRCGIYSWYVVGVNEYGDSAISETWKFSQGIGRHHFDMESIYPPNDAANLPLKIKFKYDITLYNDSIYNKTSFSLFLKNDSTSIIKFYNLTNLNEFELNGQLEPSTKYQWYILGTDPGFECSNVTTEVRAFTTMVTPVKPNLKSPINDEMNVSFNPRFIWEPVSEAKSYELNCVISPDTVLNYPGLSNTFFDIPYIMKPQSGCFWKVRAYNDAGPGLWSDSWYFLTMDINAIPEVAQKPSQLLDNIPNPFSGTTKFRFTLPVSGFIKLTVSNGYGEVIALVTKGFYDSGFHEIEWAAPNLTSGVYYYTLSATGLVQTKKMVVIK